MKKSAFKRLVDHLMRRTRGFTRLVDNPPGSKMAKRAGHESRRGCDGTMR